MKKIKKDFFITKSCDVRPLTQRESKLDTRKGMLKHNPSGYFDLTEYKEQKLFNDKKV